MSFIILLLACGSSEPEVPLTIEPEPVAEQPQMKLPEAPAEAEVVPTEAKPEEVAAEQVEEEKKKKKDRFKPVSTPIEPDRKPFSWSGVKGKRSRSVRKVPPPVETVEPRDPSDKQLGDPLPG